ncbi:hypothetical protein V8D89_006642 [Ganoderma adspersum]
MPPLLAQLQHERNKYRDVLGKVMTKKAGVEVELQELQSVKSVSGLQDASYIAEQSSGKLCILALRPINIHNVEEAVLRVQGFVVDARLPPIRQIDIPRNLNRLIDLKQSITLTGLGMVGFDDAVRGINHVSRAGSHLRTWTPGRDGQDLTLMFANRYLTSNHDVGNETSTDPSVIDPFNILRPLIKNEVHTADNVVEYWEQMDHNLSTVQLLASGQLSPLKKVKHDSGNEDVLPPPNKQLRSLTLGEPASKVDRTDVSMKEVA